jgi:aminoglycoside/choline kinase family phosphotransferase
MTAPAFEWYSGGDADRHIKRFRDIFHPLAKSLDAVAKVVILRDYHAENLLWLPERTGTAMTGLLDFQDALLGHPAYDLVSILQDARRDVAPQTETDMIAYYLANTGKDEAAFQTAYALLGAQRNLRILGIFARLCQRDGKPHYVDLIPRVWSYVQRDLAHPALADVADVLASSLPAPTNDFLEDLRARCATSPS